MNEHWSIEFDIDWEMRNKTLVVWLAAEQVLLSRSAAIGRKYREKRSRLEVEIVWRWRRPGKSRSCVFNFSRYWTWNILYTLYLKYREITCTYMLTEIFVVCIDRNLYMWNLEIYFGKSKNLCVSLCSISPRNYISHFLAVVMANLWAKLYKFRLEIKEGGTNQPSTSFNVGAQPGFPAGDWC